MNKKPVLLVVMDGVGISKTGLGDGVTLANTPTLDRLRAECPNTTLKAHGTAVGLPSDDDMGNSEVGHNALGCGQIYSQGAKLVNESIENGTIFSSDAFYSDAGQTDLLSKLGVLAVEMEAAALYMNAARAGKNALAICSISDSLVTGEELPAEERQIGFRNMMELGLSLI